MLLCTNPAIQPMLLITEALVGPHTSIGVVFGV